MDPIATRCDWREKFGQCQFAPLKPQIIHLDSGEAFCPLHTPSATPQWSDSSALALLQDAVDSGIVEFDGITLPADKGFQPKAVAGQSVLLRDCNFLGKSTLDLRGVMPGATVELGSPRNMGGRMILILSFGQLNARNCIFPETVELVPRVNGDIDIDLRRSHFMKGVEVKGPMEGVWDFSHTRFDGVFTFEPEPVHRDSKPSSRKANINFFRSTFATSATPRQAEGLYRSWREWFSEIGDKDNEGVFYALEKRSQRRGLPVGITRGFSASYDFLSSYGQSFTRPLMWLLSVQFVAGVVYAWKSRNFDPVPAWDGTIPAFTLAQVTKPFELFGVRVRPELVTQVIGDDVTPGWAIGTFVHGAISLFLFTLFVLALRWRFKRS